MRNVILIVVSILAIQAYANDSEQVVRECTTRFGVKTWMKMKGNKLRMVFSRDRYKAASLKYTGEYDGKYYFRDSEGRFRVVLKTSFFDGEPASFNYWVPGVHSRSGSKPVRFYCP